MWSLKSHRSNNYCSINCEHVSDFSMFLMAISPLVRFTFHEIHKLLRWVESHLNFNFYIN